MQLNETTLPLDQLLLDPNNYRYQDQSNFVYASEERFHEKTVQDRAQNRLESDGILNLKNSILKNGFLPVEKLVARPYEYGPNGADLYLVVEGNRRLAALQSIREDHLGGVDIPQKVLEIFDDVPVVIVESVDDPSFYEALMGVRHVAGIKQWGGYQRAKLVATLQNEHELDTGEISERLGMTAVEVNRRYRAFMAWSQMKDDEEFGQYADPNMYPVFHETVSIPVVRNWLGWNESAAKFEAEDTLRAFYRLITPSEDDEGRTIDPKINSYSDVRELREIIPNNEARRLLLDPHKSLADSVAVVRREQLSKAWLSEVSEAITALKNISADELSGLDEEEIGEVQRLKNQAAKTLEMHSKLTS